MGCSIKCLKHTFLFTFLLAYMKNILSNMAQQFLNTLVFETLLYQKQVYINTFGELQKCITDIFFN